MMYKYEPKSLKDSKLSGYVMLEALSYTEKLRYTDRCQFKFTSEGELDLESGRLESIAKMIEESEKYIKEVCIKSEDGKIEYKSYNDLQYGQDPVCGKILAEVASVILNGQQLSGN